MGETEKTSKLSKILVKLNREGYFRVCYKYEGWLDYYRMFRAGWKNKGNLTLEVVCDSLISLSEEKDKLNKLLINYLTTGNYSEDLQNTNCLK